MTNAWAIFSTPFYMDSGNSSASTLAVNWSGPASSDHIPIRSLIAPTRANVYLFTSVNDPHRIHPPHRSLDFTGGFWRYKTFELRNTRKHERQRAGRGRPCKTANFDRCSSHFRDRADLR